MTSANRQADLFTAQADLFDRYARPASPGPTPDDIRRRLTSLLSMARAAEHMPWDQRRARVNALLFHNMANWLPALERDAFRAAFTEEMERLRGA